MATHSSILAWKMLWTEEPSGYSPKSRKTVRHDRMTKCVCVHRHAREMQTQKTDLGTQWGEERVG